MLDNFLEKIFSKKAFFTFLFAGLISLIFSAANGSAGGEYTVNCTENDCISLAFCGCLTPETTCDIIDCSCRYTKDCTCEKIRGCVGKYNEGVSGCFSFCSECNGDAKPSDCTGGSCERDGTEPTCEDIIYSLKK